MSNEIKKTALNTLIEPVANSAKNITDKPTQNIGNTLADIWYLVFGSISQAAEKRKLKYSYALQEFENELKEKISKIPKDKLIEPDIQIVAPALESAKYCVEKKELRHLFSNLISSSMNTEYYDFIHPSFPLILKQLSVFDAKLFNIIYNNNISEFTNLIYNNIDSFILFIHQLSSSLTVLRNWGLITGKSIYIDYQNTDLMFEPEKLYYSIGKFLFNEDPKLYEKIAKYSDFIKTHYSLRNYSSDNSMHFINLTPLGCHLGSCCCE